ncbi:MAG: type II toxin-antitoxin system HipA family toxin [Candidimonas sp.]|nr:MAG: type II toxin-antitoxin system HipA family toxin [Candidimonas sp.]TAM24834.1 MAG: type II toxin-antitoxin system HipA family toxin [Candidimonas sp.]TAM79348.1 MAG: type II toxin-antitoxin system HipA family toxin [Candidimonas sp.]
MAAASNRSLFVFAHVGGGFLPAGKLDLTEQGRELVASTFAYGQRYLERPSALEIDPVGLSLRDKSAVRAKLLVPPNGLTFFGGVRDATLDAWGRRVIESRHQVPANSLPESTYLLEAGSERVGALDVRESLTAPASTARGSIHSLAYLMEAAERIEAGLPIPESLAEIFVAGSGLGGMRPKVSVRDDDQRLWLAKFASNNDHRLDVPMIEHATLQLARLAGLTVPEARLLQIQNKNALLIHRFDRTWTRADTPLEIRHHMVSASTLLACNELDSPSMSYMDIVGAMRRYAAATHLKADIEELYGRMVFNILVSNDDDHLRNHAFLWDIAAHGWRLSPLYDVMPRASVASERFLHLGVGPRGRLADLDNAYAAKERFGLLGADALRIIDHMWRIVREWKLHFEAFGVSHEQIERIAPAFRRIDDVSSTELRKLL